MRNLFVVAVLLRVAAGDPAAAQPADSSTLPVVTISGPTVVAFWRAPASDSELVADPSLAAALDQQQTYWADTYERLAAAGIDAVSQPGRQFRVRDPDGDRVFAAAADSSDIGYLLVAPGRAFRVFYRLRFPDDLVASAREHFGNRDRDGTGAHTSRHVIRVPIYRDGAFDMGVRNGVR